MLFGLIAWQIGNAQAGEWRVTREILGATEATAVAAVPFDDHVFANSQLGWIDVRVLDGAGREMPCVIQAERDYRFEDRHTSREAKIKSLEQITADLIGRKIPRVSVIVGFQARNAVHLQIGGQFC